MITAQQIIEEVKKQANPQKADLLSRFFKTGKGQYGEGDIFYGLMVPESRQLAKKYDDLNLNEIKKLLNSKIHEIRLIGLLILVDQFENSNITKQEKIYNFYLQNAKRINNWDLVDLTAHKIVGAWLLKKSTKKLNELARSANLWERRIAVIASFAHIKDGNFKPTITLAKKLLNDKHDLMHKAVGWMLREMGKRSIDDLLDFLDEHARTMPRTMLRYSIEKLPAKKRQHYLSLK